MNWTEFIASFFSIAFLLSLLRGATPLIFASMGGLWSERSGIIQIALEGMMLMGALFASIGGLYFHSSWLGFLFGGLAGVGASFVFGFFALFLRTDQIIVGTGLNLLALGIAPFVTKVIFNSTGSTSNLPIELRFTFEPLLLAALCVLATWYFYSRTKLGLLLRFSGEQPEAVLASGFRVDRLRWGFLSIAGFLCGLGGASLSLYLASSYSPNMTAGRGFIALAALIFGKWKPLPAVAACLFFSFVEAVQIRLQGVPLGIPVQWIQALPYIVTIVALAGFFGQSRAPKALGQHVNQ